MSFLSLSADCSWFESGGRGRGAFRQQLSALFISRLVLSAVTQWNRTGASFLFGVFARLCPLLYYAYPSGVAINCTLKIQLFFGLCVGGCVCHCVWVVLCCVSLCGWYVCWCVVCWTVLLGVTPEVVCSVNTWIVRIQISNVHSSSKHDGVKCRWGTHEIIHHV